MPADDGDFSWYQGVKISLFDVSNVSSPTELAKYEIGDRGTESPVLQDHRAFLFSQSRNLLVMPILLAEIDESQYPAGVPPYMQGEYVYQGAYEFNISVEGGITLQGSITHLDNATDLLFSGYYYASPYSVKRSLYIEQVLYTISDKKGENEPSRHAGRDQRRRALLINRGAQYERGKNGDTSWRWLVHDDYPERPGKSTSTSLHRKTAGRSRYLARPEPFEPQLSAVPRQQAVTAWPARNLTEWRVSTQRKSTTRRFTKLHHSPRKTGSATGLLWGSPARSVPHLRFALAIPMGLSRFRRARGFPLQHYHVLLRSLSAASKPAQFEGETESAVTNL